MADWTPQQLQQMNAVVMGSHDKLTPGGQIQPGYTLDQIYGGILPAGGSRPAVASNRPTSAQLAAMQAVPANSYQTPPNRPVMAPNTPNGSQYANTGNLGRATPEMQQLIQLASTGGGIRPPWTVPQAPVAQNVPLPRPRPGYAPTAIDMAAINRPVGANPGMGGAMIGNGQMASGIPPQGPPPAGITPTVWAGDDPQQAGNPLSITVRGGQQPSLTRAQQYAQANLAAQQAAQQRQAGATGQAGGYQYVNGQKVGYAPQTIGGQTYTPTNPATAYGLANAAGQINALNKQATATGQTGVYTYKNGVKTGTVGGGTGAQAYERAAAKSRDPGTSGEGGNPSWW